jgi:hypothetical protein
MTKMTSKICLFNFYTTIQDINETIRSLDTATCMSSIRYCRQLSRILSVAKKSFY